MITEKGFLKIIQKIRTYADFLFPASLTITAVYFFYCWIRDGRSVFLIACLIALVSLALVIFMNYARMPRITKQAARYILTAFLLTFFFTGYFFYEFNHRVIRDADLNNNLQRIERYNQAIDDFVKVRVSWISALNKLLLIAERKQYPALCNEFFENHPNDFTSVYLLNERGISEFGIPFTRKYKEESALKSIVTPEFVDPSFASANGNSSVKFIVPFFTPDSVPHYLVFNLRLNELVKTIRETFAGSFYILQNEKIIFSNTDDPDDGSFKEFQKRGYIEDGNGRFITRNNLVNISWQTVTVQSAAEAYPSVNSADGELTKAVLLGGCAGIAAGFILLLYLNVRVLSPVSQLSSDAAAILYQHFESAAEFPMPVHTDEFSTLTVLLKVMVKKLKEKSSELAETQKKLDTQWEAAYKIQARLLPAEPLRTAGFEIYGELISTQKNVGKYFDYFEMDEDHVGMLLIEAAGKDIAASFYAALIKNISEFYFKCFPKGGHDLHHYFRILEEQFLAARDQRLRTVAAFFAVLNTSNGIMKIINAGFENPLLIRNGLPEILDLKSRSLGAPPASGALEEMEIAIHENDYLFVHSKNVDEPVNTLLCDAIRKDAAVSVHHLTQHLSEWLIQRALPEDAAVVFVHRSPAVRQIIQVDGAPDSEPRLAETLGAIMDASHFTGISIENFKTVLGRTAAHVLKHSKGQPVDITIYSYPGFIEAKIYDNENGLDLPGLPGEAGGWEAMEKLISDWSFHNNGSGTTLCLRMFES